MRKLILKSLLFLVMLIAMVIATMVLFRSAYPLMWIIASGLFTLILIIFPYRTFFNFKNNK
jgi:hypothetical protein